MSARDAIGELHKKMEASIAGPRDLLRQMIVALLANGHLLLESLPGVAKTRAAKRLARNLDARMRRIQFARSNRAPAKVQSAFKGPRPGGDHGRQNHSACLPQFTSALVVAFEAPCHKYEQTAAEQHTDGWLRDNINLGLGLDDQICRQDKCWVHSSRYYLGESIAHIL